MSAEMIAGEFVPNVSSAEFYVQYRNTIFRIIADDTYILRLVPIDRRSADEIEAELHFQAYLFENGADVSRPITARDGRFSLEVMHDGRLWNASVFTLAEGKDWDERDDLASNAMFNIGRSLGKIHRLAKSYVPSRKRRQMWYELHELVEAPVLFAEYDSRLRDTFVEFMAKMRNMSENRDAFGLTHGDFLMSNYLIAGERVTVIDFDECEYSRYAADIATCLRCYMIGGEPENFDSRRENARRWLYELLRGYERENHLEQSEIDVIGELIRLRDFVEISQYLRLIKGGYEPRSIERRRLECDIARVLSLVPIL